MAHLFQLSQENLGMSAYEAECLLELKDHKLIKNLLFCDLRGNALKKVPRLANARKAFRILFQCNFVDLNDALSDFDFSKIYQGNFCLRIHSYGKSINEADYAKYVWRSLVNHGVKPCVDLENPKTLIEIFVLGKDAYICQQIWKNTEDFESRQAHLRPELHPTAMHPKLARTLINILNPESVIIDPFCGAGGILIEAGLMKIKSVGYDIDAPMLKRAKINLQHYRINPRLYKLIRKDSTKLRSKNIVTDLPYGKSSRKTSEILKLYSAFIRNTTGRAVIVFPDFVNYRKILKENLNKKLKIKKTFDSYVHKSLTRKIMVIA